MTVECKNLRSPAWKAHPFKGGMKGGLAIDWEPPAELVARMQGRNRFDMSPDDMAEVLNVDRATFHRYRSGFVYGVAERLGWY